MAHRADPPGEGGVHVLPETPSRPTVELVLDTDHYANGNGHAAVEVNGNGHSDEAPEPQQSLFSWAEFMAEEPVKPKGHSPQGSAPPPSRCSSGR